MNHLALPRRRLLTLGLAASAAALWPRLAFAGAATDQRFVFIILRGAMDGLNVVVPYADPDYARLRGALAVQDGATLDGLFALHPAMAQTRAMFAAGQAAFVHAVASPYRDRSHFDGQNVLETGGAAAYALKDGWLNRLVAALPRLEPAIAFAPTVPAALRGAAPVTSYAPSGLPDARETLMARVARLYAPDAQLHALWDEALAAQGIAAEAGADAMAGGMGAGRRPQPLGEVAAAFLRRPEGPRIATLEIGGWDTHAGQAGRLAAQLRLLDATLASLRDGLGDAWGRTLALAATEFGRTAAANGTGGTDHGTGGAAIIAGGALGPIGGRVHADWPGLRQLWQDRDLRPTADLRAVALALAARHFALDPARLAPALFPGAAGLRPLPTLA